jgi:hypothetical protein
MSVELKEYVIRKEGTANTYGIGEVIVPNVAFFKAGHWGLSSEQLELAIKKLGKAIIVNEYE